MNGFPIPPSRDAFGPPLESWGSVTNPRRQIGAETFNLAWWSLAAAAQLVPRAWVFVSSVGGRVASAECWNPNADVTLRPVVARVSTGIYTVTYAATYPDADGDPQELVLFSGKPTPQGPAVNLVATASVASNIVTVKVTTANTAALTDAAFELDVR